MRDLTELTDKTSSYELFTHVYWRILTRRIVGFSDLVEYLSPVEEGARKDYVLKSAFPLIREIHWGFFRELNATSHPVLWGQLTRPHPRYPFGGELKLSMTITDIYCAFIDIHGYTAFANTPRDAPMLRLLDVCIETDVKHICRDNHVVSNRARGDEIILIGTSAYDVVNAVVTIADYFGGRQLTGGMEIVKKRREDRLKLPELSVSAGIAGGKKYTTLVITAGGDLSGTVVNTAARLQARANIISPRSTRILTTETVQVKYNTDAQKEYAPLFTESRLAFLDVGSFAFKGVELRLTDVLINPGERCRMSYQDELKKFLEALKNDLWADAVFPSLVELLVAACKARLPESAAVSGNILSNLHTAGERFETGRTFSDAVSALETAVNALKALPEFDYFLRLYAESVAREYRRIYDSYNALMEDFTDKNRRRLLGQEENRLYEESLLYSKTQRKLRETIIDRIDAEKRRLLWKRVVKSVKPSVGEALYQGK